MNEYKFQWSKMDGGEQIVIRTDSKIEFDTLVAEYKSGVKPSTSPVVVSVSKPVTVQVATPPVTVAATPTTVAPTQQNLGVCSHCGSPNKWSLKKNKAYCSNLCWNNPK